MSGTHREPALQELLSEDLRQFPKGLSTMGSVKQGDSGRHMAGEYLASRRHQVLGTTKVGQKQELAPEWIYLTSASRPVAQPGTW